MNAPPSNPTAMTNMVAMLICDDVPESIRFYQDILGFTLVHHDETVGKSGWAMLQNGPAQLMLASPEGGSEPVKVEGAYPQSVYYLYPENFDALYAHIREKSYTVSEIRETFYNMREFDLLDPSGHCIWCGADK